MILDMEALQSSALSVQRVGSCTSCSLGDGMAQMGMYRSRARLFLHDLALRLYGSVGLKKD